MPGKRSQTDRLTAPAGSNSSSASPATTHALSGTAWLDGLLGFVGAHAPTGECNCAGCAAGRAAPRGFGGAEDKPLNEVESKDGGGADAGKPPVVSSASAPAEQGGPGAPGAPGAPAHASTPVQPGSPGQAATPGQPAPAAAPGPPAQAGQQGTPGHDAAAQPAQPGSDTSGQQAGPGGQAKAPPPPPPTITSATRKAAPGGAAATRTTVGVGEIIDFTGSTAGTWTASGGTPATGAAGTAFAWTAPSSPSTVTISLTVGAQTTTASITVIAPSSLSMVVATNHGLTAGTAGVCMVTDVSVGPTTVCFGNTEWLEVPGPASGVAGYFTKFSAATIYHHPNPGWLPWNDRNTGLQDHAAWHAVPPPYSVGGFTWSVPNKYRVAGTSGGGTVFTTTTQQFSMIDTAGTMSVSKAGASATRTP